MRKWLLCWGVCSAVIMGLSSVALAEDYLFICNSNVKLVDKQKKEGPTPVNASASVALDSDRRTAELIVGSKANKQIGQHANKEMPYYIEHEDSATLITGVTADESIYFTLNTEKNELIASYSDIVLLFQGCIDMRKEK